MNYINLEQNQEVLSTIHAALREDGVDHDVTSLSLVDPSATITATILARHSCRTAGANIGKVVMQIVDPNLEVEILAPDGSDIDANDAIMRIKGKAASILGAERVSLNFMQRMTGIATATKVFVDAVAGTKCQILDTRKTVPGLRLLDKYSVKAGGGTNHRMGLHDMVLIKDNHRKLWRSADKSRLDLAVAAARDKFPGVPVEVEVETLEELESALSASPEWIMLDNMPTDLMRKAVAITAGRCKLEASGGINASTVRAVAETGVDAISLGCLTHSVIAAEFCIEIEG